MAAQTKRWAEGIRVPAPLAGRGSEAIGLTLVETIIVVLLGAVIAGISGMILAVPAAALLKLLYFGHLILRVDSLEKTPMVGKIESRRRRG